MARAVCFILSVSGFPKCQCKVVNFRFFLVFEVNYFIKGWINKPKLKGFVFKIGKCVCTFDLSFQIALRPLLVCNLVVDFIYIVLQ